jgi:hypothetical protein
MTTYSPSDSAVFARLFAPVAASYPGSFRQYHCTELSDLDFLEMGIARCLSDSRTGRDFLQRHGDNGRKQVSVDLFFKGLQSNRRLENLCSINKSLKSPMAQPGEDPFASIPELDGFALYAGDGHFHGAAARDPRSEGSDGELRKRQVGHFFMLNLRTQHMDHLALGELGGKRKGEHDMHAIKRSETDALRGGEPKGRKVILVWDRAGIDFRFWQNVKCSAGLYFLSREKDNMKLVKAGDRPFDRDDARNAGVVADETVTPASGGAALRRITYTDPIAGTRYTYLTTEMTLPPGILVLLYKQRWEIEKVYDELKSKLQEGKAWASSRTAKTVQAQFLCLAHNLMVLLERQIIREEGVDNGPERKRREVRREQAINDGANFIGTVLQRFTVRSLKFIRWLRNFMYRNDDWRDAIDRLRVIYAVF